MITVVTVPATTANLGPGFDCLGAALTLTNTFTFSLSDRPHVKVRGTEAAGVSNSSDNLAYRATIVSMNISDGKPHPCIWKLIWGFPSRGV